MAIRFAQSAPAAPKELPAPVAKLSVRIERTVEAPKPKHAGGRPPTGKAKVVLNIRVDADVLQRWKDSGDGWQARMNEYLKAAKV
jgi:uncharacterized protein (DUF4415 family)